MVYQIMLTSGIALILVSGFTLSRSLSFLKRSERAVGKVIRLDIITDTEGTTYKPVFTFKTAAQQEITYIYPYSSSPAQWNIGDEATIAYDTNNPDKARVLTYFGTFGLTAILMAVALPLLVVSAGFYWSKQYLL